MRFSNVYFCVVYYIIIIIVTTYCFVSHGTRPLTIICKPGERPSGISKILAMSFLEIIKLIYINPVILAVWIKIYNLDLRRDVQCLPFKILLQTSTTIFFNVLLDFIFYFNCWALDKIKEDIAIDWLVTVYRNMSGHYASLEETCSLYTNNVQPYIVLKKVEDLYLKLMSKFKIPNLRYQFIFKPTL